MVHTFECLGRRFAIDSESGSVFETDDITEKLLESPNARLGDFSDFPFGQKAAEYGVSEANLRDAAAELTELYKAGILFRPQPEYAEPVYHGIIKAMCLNVSHCCNLRCEYCFADGGTYNTAAMNMPPETAIKAIDFLIKKSGNRRNLEVDFFGGEPLLNMETVRKTVAYARRVEKEAGKSFRFTITTNAYALDSATSEYLNSVMYNVVLSIDGRKRVHDEVRKTASGGVSFDRSLANALRFRQIRGDGQYYVRGTYTALNKDFCADVAALNDYGFDQISVEPVVLPEDNRLALKEEDVPFLEKEYEKLAAMYLERRKTDKWFNFFHFMLDLDDGPCEAKRMSGCGAGNEYVAVNPNGDIYPCHQFDGDESFKMGSVLDGSFNTDIAEYFAKNNLTKKPDCLNCWAKYYCSGGCAANAIRYGGGIDKPNAVSCALMKKRIECAVAVAAIEKQNKMNN